MFWYFVVTLLWGIFGLILGSTLERLNLALQTDELTKLFNYKSLRSKLDKELTRAKKSGQELSMLLIDIDYFKIINDLHGHLEGDELIAVLAEIIRESFPNTKLNFRWGGEEFIILMPNTKNQRAYFLVENFRKRVNTAPKFKRNSVSVGLATCNGVIDKDRFFDSVDKAMYQAKLTRNAVYNAGYVHDEEETL